jgi:hypothetical protein
MAIRWGLRAAANGAWESAVVTGGVNKNTALWARNVVSAYSFWSVSLNRLAQSHHTDTLFLHCYVLSVYLKIYGFLPVL